MYFNIVDCGQRIKNLRMGMGLTQEKLAERVGVSCSTIGNAEIGKRSISIDLVIQLAEVFDCTIDDLVLGREYIPKRYKTSMELMDAVLEVLKENSNLKGYL